MGNSIRTVMDMEVDYEYRDAMINHMIISERRTKNICIDKNLFKNYYANHHRDCIEQRWKEQWTNETEERWKVLKERFTNETIKYK
jgi:hypothetical protein